MDHPFQAWRERQSLTREQAAERIRTELLAVGRNSQFSEAYLYQIEAGKASPGWPVCKAMEVITSGTVAAGTIKDWQPTPGPDAA